MNDSLGDSLATIEKLFLEIRQSASSMENLWEGPAYESHLEELQEIGETAEEAIAMCRKYLLEKGMKDLTPEEMKADLPADFLIE